MTLQQLRYLIAIAEAGSISAAAYNIYASQSNLSIAMKELEHEFDITIFTRSNRGVTLTNEGTELLAYARQVVEQADMLENRFAGNESGTRRLAISTQHYAFCVRAFINTVERCEDEDYDFVLREAPTNEIIEDAVDRSRQLHPDGQVVDAFDACAEHDLGDVVTWVVTWLLEPCDDATATSRPPLVCGPSTPRIDSGVSKPARYAEFMMPLPIFFV